MPVDVRDPRTRSFGHIDPENMDANLQTQDRLAVSASMRTALLVYSGITVKMMVDSDLGAQLHTMFMVQYQPGGFAGAHDHPFEETYLILEGEVDAVFDGEEYHMVPGDVAFAGVGAVHQFSNPGPGIVRWLETQAPQPPAGTAIASPETGTISTTFGFWVMGSGFEPKPKTQTQYSIQQPPAVDPEIHPGHRRGSRGGTTVAWTMSSIATSLPSGVRERMPSRTWSGLPDQ